MSSEQHADLDAAVIEQRTIAQVPLSERHGRVRDLFTIWFGSNVMLLTIVLARWRRPSTGCRWRGRRPGSCSAT